MRFRPANNSLINSRSTPPTTLAAIVIQSCNSNSSEIFSLIHSQRLTGPSITGCVQRSVTHHGFRRIRIGVFRSAPHTLPQIDELASRTALPQRGSVDRSLKYRRWTSFTQHCPSTASNAQRASAVLDFAMSSRIRTGIGSRES